MGFHMFDLIIVAVIGLAIFGPKAFQSVARSAGKGIAQAKDAKEKIMAELPLEEIAKVTDSIPFTPQQAVRMLMTPEKRPEKDQPVKTATRPVETNVDV